jgi:hypothetical protein
MRSMYRPPSKPPETPWARHIDRVMQREGWSQTKAFKVAREALGLGEESRSAFLPYLIDKEPDAEQAKALASVFGWPDAEDEPKQTPPAPAEDPVVEAINRQTKAIERLADHVEALLASRDKDLAALALTVGQALRGRAAPDRTRAS